MILKEEDNGASYATGLYLKVLSKITKEHTNPNNINYIYFNNNRKNIDKIIIEKTIQDFIIKLIVSRFPNGIFAIYGKICSDRC